MPAKEEGKGGKKILIFPPQYPTFTKLVCVSVLVAQLCPTLCDSMDCRPPGSSVHGALQERILE